MSVKTLRKFIVIPIIGTLLLAAVYRYSQTSVLQLVVEASHQGMPLPLRWAAFNALLHLHPSAEDIAELNQQAGARYLLALPDENDAETLLRHYRSRGLDLDSQDLETGSGLTALQVAAIANEPEDVALLLRLGADADAKDSRGRTALTLVTLSQQNRPGVDFSRVLALLRREGA